MQLFLACCREQQKAIKCQCQSRETRFKGFCLGFYLDHCKDLHQPNVAQLQCKSRTGGKHNFLCGSLKLCKFSPLNMSKGLICEECVKLLQSLMSISELCCINYLRGITCAQMTNAVSCQLVRPPRRLNHSFGCKEQIIIGEELLHSTFV